MHTGGVSGSGAGRVSGAGGVMTYALIEHTSRGPVLLASGTMRTVFLAMDWGAPCRRSRNYRWVWPVYEIGVMGSGA